MLIKPQSMTGIGIQVVLVDNNNLLVAAGVTIRSIDYTAVSITGGSHDVTIAGKVIAEATAIDLSSGDNNQSVSVLKGAQLIAADGYGIYISGLNAVIINRGLIASDEGVMFDAAGAGTARIDNFGTINGYGVSTGAQKLMVKNFGIISTPDMTAVSGSLLKDTVINKGTIIGTIDFSAGNDLYDGRGGLLIGEVYGGGGNDLFRLGTGTEFVFGGTDFDTLDFRSGGAVKVALDGSFANTGSAKTDSYAEIERIFGSATGADRLRGDTGFNELRGFGGNDRLEGGFGVDTLVGGLGKDTLTGGIGNDHYVFGSLAEAGDKITDFGNSFIGNLDTIDINGITFGGGLFGGGFLLANQFKSGMNNHANTAAQRFIFRTTDATLWFDKDGNGSNFNPVLVADLQDTVLIDQSDIFIL